MKYPCIKKLPKSTVYFSKPEVTSHLESYLITNCTFSYGYSKINKQGLVRFFACRTVLAMYVLSQRKSIFSDITWNVAGKRDITRNISCSIMFSTTFNYIPRKFGLLFGQCGGKPIHIWEHSWWRSVKFGDSKKAPFLLVLKNTVG